MGLPFYVCYIKLKLHLLARVLFLSFDKQIHFFEYAVRHPHPCRFHNILLVTPNKKTVFEGMKDKLKIKMLFADHVCSKVICCNATHFRCLFFEIRAS